MCWKSVLFRLLITVKVVRSRYPAITEAEEAVSIPLQLLCGAIFDATLVHMLNTVAPGTWFPLKQSICESLVPPPANNSGDHWSVLYWNSVRF